MIEGIEILKHSAIKINKGKMIYIDPYLLDREYHDADIIFVTHDHFDHFSSEDLKKVMKDDSKIVVTSDLEEKTLDLGFKKENICLVKPNESYNFGGICFKTIPSYNVNKDFHPRKNNWVAYLIEIDNVIYYIAGDTDINEDNKLVKCDVAFIPVGGVYTTDFKEAAELINIIKPSIVIPTHYGEVAGSIDDAKKFKELLNDDIVCHILLK